MDDKKPKIKIKPENKGKFTDWCESHGYKGANASCQEEGLASKMANVRRMAQFAKNAKSWNN